MHLATLFFIVLFLAALNLLFIAGLIWVICWGIGYEFTWSLVFALWASYVLIRHLFHRK